LEENMSATDQMLENAEHYAATFDKGDLPIPPETKVAVVACMDARLNVYGLLGLGEGGTPVASSPTIRSVRSPSPNTCSAPRRSSSSTTPTVG